MLRIAICDDEASSLTQIQSLISAWHHDISQLTVDTFSNGDSLIKSHALSPYDIILLDIIMPLFNGIEIARDIRENDSSVKIIFLTSSSEYAVESYTVKANNYLLKPINSTQLYQCLDELYCSMCNQPQYIIIKCANSIHKVLLNDIEFVEAQNKHSLFTLTNKQTLDSIEMLYLHENMLNLTNGFYKCHRSYIVNINHIDTYTTKEVYMRSGYRIPISRTYGSDFKNAYFSYTFKKAGESI